MKSLFTLITLLLSLTSFASGLSTVSLILEQNEVEKLENAQSAKGFTLSKIVDVYATRGAVPRCPCSSFELTFTKVRNGKSENKVFDVNTQGFGTSLKVTVSPSK